MKYLLLIIVFYIHSTSAQTIAENKVDDFTKDDIKRTSWEYLSKSNMHTHVRVSKINGNTILLDFRIMFKTSFTFDETVFAVSDGDAIMVKLDNDSVVTLKNAEYKISCRGCGAINIIGSEAQGVNITTTLDLKIIALLSRFKITKIRLYTITGYRESEVGGKHQEIIKKELALINQ